LIRADVFSSPQGFPEFLTLLGRHLLPSFDHAKTPMAPADSAVQPATETAQQDPAQYQKTQGLTETDCGNAEDCRHEPVPQRHRDKAENRDGNSYDNQKLKYPNSIPFNHADS
jgi:hypothetical protein